VSWIVFWKAVLPGIVVLGFVIFVHELGHFLMAKWRGVRVLRFSLGFGPRMVGFTRGGTEYRLAWIPFGGYVQMAGDSPDPDRGMPGGRDEFLSHPWQGRLLIALAGPMANLITAFMILCMIGMFVGYSAPDSRSLVGVTPDTSLAYARGVRQADQIVSVAGRPVSTWQQVNAAADSVGEGQTFAVGVRREGRTLELAIPRDQRLAFFRSLNAPSLPPIVGGVSVGMPAYKAGLKQGDRVLAIDDRPITTWDELPQAIQTKVDQPVKLKIERDGKLYDFTVVPMSPEGRGKSNGLIGIEAPREMTYVQKVGVLQSIKLGALGTLELIPSIYRGMWLTITRPLYYREYVGGPLFIAQAASEQAKRGLDFFLGFVAMISVAIMAFNLLPLPVLDGGHILLALIEAVRRQAISARAYLRFQQFGLVVMGTLLVLILANDPLRVVQRQRALGNATPSADTTPQPTSPKVPQETPVAPNPP